MSTSVSLRKKPVTLPVEDVNKLRQLLNTKGNRAVEKVKSIMSKHPINAKLPEEEGTVLTLAASHNNFPAAKVLLEMKANPDVTDQKGWNAMHYASHFGNFPMVMFLVQKGANINAKTKEVEEPPFL